MHSNVRAPGDAQLGKPQSAATLGFLAGGGEMGERTRAKDWSHTPVGCPASWSHSLKTSVSICLGSRHPMVVWWGRPEYTQFYNDAYISFLGRAKHPASLGRSGRECWSEIWPVIGPMLDSVYATGQATWSEDLQLILERNLPREEAYFTFSYGPVRDDDGTIQGIFCACNETTARVIGERRLRTLRDLNRVGAAARTAKAACELATPALAENPGDIPFTLVYLLDGDAATAELVATTGLAASSAAVIPRIALRDAARSRRCWPLHRVLESGEAQLIGDITGRFGPVPGGLWPEPARAALILPIAAPGREGPTGFLVAGLSPRRVFDCDYRSFLEMVAGHIGTSVANARAYEHVRLRAERLQAAERHKDEFLAMLAHELRNPLATLTHAGELLLQLSSAGSNVQLAAGMVKRQVSQLTRLVDDLLDVTRITQGRIELKESPLDLATVVAQAMEMIEPKMREKGHNVSLTFPSEPLYVRGDFARLVQCVGNVLANAAKYTDTNGEIRIQMRAEGIHAAVEISDNGMGIAPELLPRIFDLFVQCDHTMERAQGGLGIGLSVVKRLVEMHRGCVEARSAGVGAGSTFQIRLPRFDPRAGVELAHQRDVDGETTAPSL